MRIALLGSGSSGNVTLFEAAGDPLATATRPTRVIVDAGLSRREIERRLKRVPAPGGGDGLAVADLDAVLVTHDHNDHLGCAGSLGRPIFAPAAARRAGELTATRVLAGQRFAVGLFDVLPVLLPHDADETVGYVLSADGVKVGILTDCGEETAEIVEAYAGCDVLILETNHDATMLKFGPYPPSLKRRVGGSRGHLSNEQAAHLLRGLCRAGAPPRVVIAAHLSQANNRPVLAKSALDRVLRGDGRVIVASQLRGTPLIVATPDGVSIEPLRRQQLAFAFASEAGPVIRAEASPNQPGAIADHMTT
jgi:phosphoribosyl 1,2-cyclic phosphodiesterase